MLSSCKGSCGGCWEQAALSNSGRSGLIAEGHLVASVMHPLAKISAKGSCKYNVLFAFVLKSKVCYKDCRC
jgi:hypothetical protein